MTDVRAEIGYSQRTERKPYFYANAHEKDFVPLKPAEVMIADARGRDRGARPAVRTRVALTCRWPDRP